MDDDDRPIGRILSRREMLALFGGSAALLAACGPSAVRGPAASAQATAAATAAAAAAAASAAPTQAGSVTVPSCIVKPALTEGPYFVDEKLNRSDIRSDPSNNTVKEGAQLNLTINVARLSGTQCTAFGGAMVDVWQCDALGVYSDVVDQGFNTRGTRFLRGYQNTDAGGTARFTTIYPGWYQGRAVHIHFKIRTSATAGRAGDFTSQWFFDDTVSDQLFTSTAPYTQKGANRGTRNANDGIYREGGDKLLLNVTKTGSIYSATFDIGVQI